MNTLTDKTGEFERVIYIAFGCACVREFHVEQPTLVQCPEHGDHIISTTVEYRRPECQAA